LVQFTAAICLLASGFCTSPTDEVKGSFTPALGATPDGFQEAGAPPFIVLGAESLGLTSPAVDLQLMPDGRLLAWGRNEFAIGDGLRWEVYRQKEGDRQVDTFHIAVGEDGTIYVGVAGGISQVVFLSDGFWKLERVVSTEGVLGTTPSPLNRMAKSNAGWFWWWGSGPILAWQPGTEPRVAGRGLSIEGVFDLGPATFLGESSTGGLQQLSAGTFAQRNPISDGFVDATLTASMTLTGKYYAGTQGRGLFQFINGEFIAAAGSPLLDGTYPISGLIPLATGGFAAALDNYGVVVFDENLREITSLTRTFDQRLSRPRKLIQDNHGDIWALLNNGIARFTYPSAITHFEPLISTGLIYAQLCRLEQKLWLMSDGKIQEGLYNHAGKFEQFRINTPQGFAHMVLAAGDRLLASTDAGIFQLIDNQSWECITSEIRTAMFAPNAIDGFWYFGAENEFGRMQLVNGRWKIERYPVSNLGMVFRWQEDGAGNYWLELGSGRVAKVTAGAGQPQVRIYDARDGLTDGWTQLFVVDGRIQVNLEAKVLTLDPVNDRWTPSKDLIERIPAMRYPIGRPARDALGRLWVPGRDGVTLVGANGKTDPQGRLIPNELNPIILYMQPDGVTWLHQRRRLTRFDPNVPARISPPPVPMLARLTSTISGSVHRPKPGEALTFEESDASLSLAFVAPGSPLGRSIEFQFRIQDDTTPWLSAGPDGRAVLTRLKADNYLLRVRTRIGDEMSGEATHHLIVTPPWHHTALARVCFGTLFVMMIIASILIPVWFERRQKRTLERLVSKRTHELAESEARLRQSEERFRRLSDNAPDVIFRIDLAPAPHFSYLNPEFTRVTGHEREEFLSPSSDFLHKLIHPEDRQVLEDVLTGAAIDESARTLRWLAYDARILHVEQRWVAVRDEGGRIVGIEGIARDITERVREREQRRVLETQLAHAQKLETIGTLAGGIAHDFNNILTGILGYTELARLNLPPDSEIQPDLGEIQNAGQRAKDLVAQILTFSRKSESRLQVQRIDQVIGEAIRLLRATLPPSVKVESELARLFARVDQVEIHQIILNLGTNAHHAMRQGKGTIRFLLDSQRVTDPEASLPPGDYLRIRVQDDGAGMDLETQQRIWEPFFTTKREGEGTGLGLSLVRRIVTGLNGSVSVTSALNVGTVFTLLIPASAEEQATPRELPTSISGRGERIAIVDDETSISTYIALRLTQANFNVSVFRKPEDVLDAWKAEPNHFSVFLVDHHMPGMDGPELLTKLREAGSDAAFILMSGSGPLEGATRFGLGCIETLQKPFSGQELLEALARALKVSS
jgi:PAS domain S-box-containing protein